MSIFDGIKKKDSSEIEEAFKKNLERNKKEISIFGDLKKDKPKEDKKEDEEKLGGVSGMFLPKNNVAIPYYFSQTAIYAPRATSNRRDRNISVPIWSQGKMSVSYQGPELDTKIDYKLMSIILKARDQLPEDKHIVKLKYKETMKALGLNPHHPDARKKFHASIERHLSAKFYFSVDCEKEGFWKSLIDAEKTVFSYTRNILIIQLSDFVPKLFNYDRKETFSIEDMLLSFSISDSYATKLYSYYESNKHPFAIKISTILKICDHPLEENQKPTNNNRATVRKALNELVSKGFLKSWKFEDGNDKRDPLVVVQKMEKEERPIIPIEFKDDFLDC